MIRGVLIGINPENRELHIGDEDCEIVLSFGQDKSLTIWAWLDGDDPNDPERPVSFAIEGISPSAVKEFLEQAPR